MISSNRKSDFISMRLITQGMSLKQQDLKTINKNEKHVKYHTHTVECKSFVPKILVGEVADANNYLLLKIISTDTP